jgi:DNA mismatch endonuclease Vsr
MSESHLVRPVFDDVPPARRRNLAAVAAKDTAPELVVRRVLYRMGYRFRLHRRDLPGTPDIVLSGRRKIIEVRGCFWHRHPDPACRNAVLPRVRAAWWAAKLARNVERDERNLASLRDAGWSVLVLWECETKDTAALGARLRSFLQ